MTLSLLTYVATVFAVHVPWHEAMKGTFLPAFHATAAYTAAIVAILGTTISPYLFSWQAAQEVEEIRDSDEREPLKHADQQAPNALKRIAIDISVGMVVSNVIAFFIILTAAVVLHAHAKTDIQSSSEAAEALKPVAGKFAFALFSMGIVGTDMLAVPVLAGATAFTVAGTMRHRTASNTSQAKPSFSMACSSHPWPLVYCLTRRPSTRSRLSIGARWSMAYVRYR